MSNVNAHKPGYKHTPLGWIPEEWEVKKLKDISEKIGDGLHGTPEYVSKSAYFFINGNNLIDNKIKIYDSTKCVSEPEFVKHKKELKSKSILISINGTIGNVALYSNENIVLGKSVAYINCLDEYVDYVFQALQSSFINKFYQNELTGSTIQNLSLASLRNIPIPLPTHSERDKIAIVFNVWDTAILETQSLIKALQRRHQQLMHQLFVPKNNWKVYHIGQLISEIIRPVSWDENELYDLISVRRRSAGAFFRQSLYGRNILTKQLYTVCEGDFLISKMQIVHGASAIVTSDLNGMKISGSYIAVRSKNDKVLNIEFFNWLSKTPSFYRLAYICSCGVHIEKMTFDYKDFIRRKIAIPATVKEQIEIVKTLETSAKEVKEYKNYLTVLENQKKALMQKLLTGEIRVKTGKTSTK